MAMFAYLLRFPTMEVSELQLSIMESEFLKKIEYGNLLESAYDWNSN